MELFIQPGGIVISRRYYPVTLSLYRRHVIRASHAPLMQMNAASNRVSREFHLLLLLLIDIVALLEFRGIIYLTIFKYIVER